MGCHSLRTYWEPFHYRAGQEPIRSFRMTPIRSARTPTRSSSDDSRATHPTGCRSARTPRSSRSSDHPCIRASSTSVRSASAHRLRWSSMAGHKTTLSPSPTHWFPTRPSTVAMALINSLLTIGAIRSPCSEPTFPQPPSIAISAMDPRLSPTTPSRVPHTGPAMAATSAMWRLASLERRPFHPISSGA